MAIRKISTQEFNEEVKTSQTPVFVNFFATWCMPCRMFSDQLSQVAETDPNINIVRLDVDQNPEVSRSYGVMSIPTSIVLKDGKEVERIVGYRQANQVVELMAKYN